MIPLEIHAKKFMKQNSYGFDCERVIGDKPKHTETSISGCKRKRVFSGKRMSNPISKRFKERVSIPDQDYLIFLELIKGAVNKDCDSEKLVEEKVNAGEDNDDSVDPQYKIFLENAREEGDAYVLEMKEVDGKADVVKYEEEGEELSDGVKNGGLSKGREKEANVSMEPKIKDLDGAFGGRKFLSDCPPEMMAGADKNYLQFLKNVWVKDSSFAYVHDNVILNLEDDIIGDETGSEIPGQPHSSTKFTPHTDPGTSKLAVNESDSESVEILDSYEKVDYKGVLLKKLKTVLQKPFDPKEYIEKLEDAKTRKPLEKSRITRGRVVSYPTEESSPSYLDLHPDLRNMFDSAMQKNDPLRALALLRCLFFYYKYVSHPGSVVPWKYPSDWLHDMICSCVDNLKCPMKNASKLYKEL